MKTKKKYAIAAAAILFLSMMVGCGEAKDDKAEAQKEIKVEAEMETQQDRQSNVEGIIENQTFEIELDDWGKVTFASMEPKDGSNQPEFALIEKGEIVYEFPKTKISSSDTFEQVSGVKFTDLNMDKKKDILVLVQYSDGENTWKAPVVFLQEYSDNMMYLDYPELESYKIEADTPNGVPFYRDTMLEEYISKQQRTETLSDMEGIWIDYIEYLDEQYYQIISIEKQIEIFAQEKSQWAVDVDYADEKYCFTLAGLDNDGRIELIVSNFGGTGFYTYSHFYKIDDDGKLKELETTFTEGDSQPDIMDDLSNETDITVYSYISDDGKGNNNFIVYDQLKESPDSYIYRVSSLAIVDDVVTETQLANQRVTYEGEDYLEHIVSQDYSGKELTETEYDNYPEEYYKALNAAKYTAHFEWKNVSDLSGLSDSDVIQILTDSYEKYNCQ